MHRFRDSDRNTKFFNMSATMRKHFKKIDILIGEEELEVIDQVGM